MKHIDIEYVKSILNYNPDTGIFTKKYTINGIEKIKVIGYKDSNGYLRVSIKGSLFKLHRIAWAISNNSQPLLDIDHINGNPSDNRIINLRIATDSQNQANSKRYKNNTSGVKGVTWDKNNNKWNAQIQKNKKKINLGYYNNIEDAAMAYRNATNSHNGEFARYE